MIFSPLPALFHISVCLLVKYFSLPIALENRRSFADRLAMDKLSPNVYDEHTSTERDEYMQYFTENFSDELLALYEVDGSIDAVQHLTACIESGIDVWHHPLQVPTP